MFGSLVLIAAGKEVAGKGCNVFLNGLSWFSVLFHCRHINFLCSLSLLSPSRPTFVLSVSVEDQHGLPLGERYPWEVSWARSGYVP